MINFLWEVRPILKKAIRLSPCGPTPHVLPFEAPVFDEVVLDTPHLCDSGPKLAYGALALLILPVRANSNSWLHAIIPAPAELNAVLYD